jgi:hypothetical protein
MFNWTAPCRHGTTLDRKSGRAAVNYLAFQNGRRSLCAGVATIAAVLLGHVSLAASEPVRKSGYAVGMETCGSGDLAFPRVQIDMKAGFCAGLVASEEGTSMAGCCCSIRARPAASASRSS